MRQSLCAFFLVLGLVLHVAIAQPTGSLTGTITVSNSNSITVTPSNSNSNSGSNSVSPSNSGSVSRTGSFTASVSSSVTVTKSASPSNTGTGTPSNTVTPPPAPVNLQNLCKNHIINICPSWSDPPGFTYVAYLVTFVQSGCATCTPISFTTTRQSGRVTNLLPNTPYDFTVQGFDATGLASLVSAPTTFTTAAADAKINPNLDIHNITCVSAKDSTTGRSVISCNWLAANPAPVSLNIKWRCTSPIRKPDEHRKKLFKSAAAVTSIILKVNRDVATCNVYFHAYYARRPATRHSLVVVTGQ
jgi:hypothetical protein